MAEGINKYILIPILGLFDAHLSPDHMAGYVIAAIIHAVLIINLIALGALLFIWMERKISGRIQDRLGPTRVGGKFGWLQTLADGLKLLTKEDLTPGNADRFLFKIAPYVSFCASFCAFIAIPFAVGWVAQHMNVAAFFVAAVLGLEVFGVILAGYSSGSKWSLFGAMREAAQVVSYEVPLGLCIAVPVLLVGSMDLMVIANDQKGWFISWLIFHNVFAFFTFWIYFTCALASVNRAPFDLAEAESELVAGFHTEYSGMRWSFFFMAEYGSMLAVSMLGAILFLGGWNGPLPVTEWLGLTYANGELVGYLGNLLGLLNLLLKGVLGIAVMVWIRWTLPRLRIDQVITTCWKYCTPLVCVMFVGVSLWKVLLPDGLLLALSDDAPTWGVPFGEVHEATPWGTSMTEGESKAKEIAQANVTSGTKVTSEISGDRGTGVSPVSLLPQGEPSTGETPVPLKPVPLKPFLLKPFLLRPVSLEPVPARTSSFSGGRP